MYRLMVFTILLQPKRGRDWINGLRGTVSLYPNPSHGRKKLVLFRCPGWGWTKPDYEISSYRISSINLTFVTETISVLCPLNSGDSAVSDQLIQCKTLLVSEIDRLPGSACPFLFSPVKPGYHDLVTAPGIVL